MAKSSSVQIRVPPQNIESERALLGSIMLKQDALYSVIDIISPQSFYAAKHRTIYQAMIDLFDKGEPIDLLSVCSRLKEKKTLQKVGGRSYVAELVNSVPSSGNAKHYANLVQKAGVMRGLIEVAEQIAELGYKEEEELEKLLDSAEKKMFGVTNSPTLHKFVALKETLSEAWERLDHLHKSKDEIRGVRSGFAQLDNLLAGFQNSDLIILAARPSMGKTSLALDIARQTATMYDTPVGIFSLEMSSQQLVDRMLAAQSRVNAWKLRTGKLSTDDEFNQLRKALETLSKAPIYIDDQPSSSVLRMRSVARRLKSEHGIGLLIVDYLQLILPPSGRSIDSRVQEVTEISRSLKILARELNIPVIALSQLSRAIEQRRGRPRLSDLRDSGSIEQDADVVAFIHREDRYSEDSSKPNIAEILVEKHRNGPIGKIELYFDEKKASFLGVDSTNFDEEMIEVPEASTETDEHY
jgi:replicative DNA helicase